MYKSIAVFCGSNSGNDPIYEQHAKDIGTLLAEKNIMLVYGGGNTGLMGIVANTVLQEGGKVIGVIPELLKNIERHHKGLTELHIVADMHTRKKMMYELSDAAIVLPGGNGTLDEMFEMITWNALTIHNKKIILLNTAGFYNALIGHINQMQVQGFLHTDLRDTFEIYDTPDAVIASMV
ncbi:TIGR00730 family Rossman fold protein [Panacibacter ginsenosidivorans]|uniref:Cytokinin riboside 5'-monophosphate phosphoribohydrolase n=1 Tax=Panacibacter ginsenosidivorans TaxID=1813871 RepID=A0A5B8V8N8_9BACT|nr:TIGR00730 family Rossman fold protein [Panacibacter ginsenosidivorans]QEC67764.1 TIGR00730 family Rossman fold protein [Panacibacter ginsenosidivorans]